MLDKEGSGDPTNRLDEDRQRIIVESKTESKTRESVTINGLI